MRRNVIRVLLALVVVLAATVVGQTLTPAQSATPPPPAASPLSGPATTGLTTTTDAPATTTTEPRATPTTVVGQKPTGTKPSATDPLIESDDRAIRPGQKGERVLALQKRLQELGYWLGTPDATYGHLTVQAVTAFQKVEGLGRDGIAGQSTQDALAQAGRPSARSNGGDLVEVDKAHQVLLVVRDGRVRWVLNTSTGTEKRYQVNGRTELADTPPGRWQVGRVVNGVDHGPLGGLYKPRYFHRDGIAVHGYHSVPAFAASHGCVRVSEPAMDWIWATDVMPVGSAVWVY